MFVFAPNKRYNVFTSVWIINASIKSVCFSVLSDIRPETGYSVGHAVLIYELRKNAVRDRQSCVCFFLRLLFLRRNNRICSDSFTAKIKCFTHGTMLLRDNQVDNRRAGFSRRKISPASRLAIVAERIAFIAAHTSGDELNAAPSSARQQFFDD